MEHSDLTLDYKCVAEQQAKGLPVHAHNDECAEATMALAAINLKLHGHVWKP